MFVINLFFKTSTTQQQTQFVLQIFQQENLSQGNLLYAEKHTTKMHLYNPIKTSKSFGDKNFA